MSVTRKQERREGLSSKRGPDTKEEGKNVPDKGTSGTASEVSTNVGCWGDSEKGSGLEQS